MPQVPEKPKFIAIWMAISCIFAIFVGCQRRAYTDLYAESMAGEIRELEDRIYEYDAAYQGVEEELAILQSENQKLHHKLMTMQTETPKSSSSGQSLFKGFQGSIQGSNNAPNSSSSKSQRDTNAGSSEPSFRVMPKSDSAPSVIPSTPPPSTSGESKTPSIDHLPPPTGADYTKPGSVKPKTESKDLEPPRIEIPGSSMPPPSSGPKLNVPSIPTPGSDSFLPPPIKDSLAPPPNSGTDIRSRQNRAGQVVSKDDLNAAQTQSNPTNNRERSAAMEALPKSIDDEAIDAGKIELPIAIQPAAYYQPKMSDGSSALQDTKVIEVAFHPTLCRGQVLESTDANDGLYLVLQPRNAAGQTIDLPASLTVVALDPNRPDNQSKIGRWTFTEEEVDAMLEPIGISHGFHIPLQWQAVKPSGDAVQIHIRYEMNDGRRLINERRIQLHVPSAGSASWTPRVAK